MEDCWLEKEEFNFDIPLSPLHDDDGETKDTSKTQDLEADDDDEVFFGPVGVMEKCAAVVAEKGDIKPLEPLCPQEQAILLRESVALSVMLKQKPLLGIQNRRSPVAIVHPMKSTESPAQNPKLSNIDITTGKENKENIEKDNPLGRLNMKKEMLTSGLKNNSINGVNNSKLIPKRNLSLLTNNGDSFNKSGLADRQNKSNSSFGSEKLKPRGIPRMLDSKSKIARPSSIPSLKPASSIPSLKPGLLSGQPKLRGTVNQDSKLKPMKATHAQVKTSAANDPGKGMSVQAKSQSTDASKSTRMAPMRIATSGLAVTPVSKDSRRGSDASQRRRSNGMTSSSSTSRLSFPKPSNNSTPMRPTNTSLLSRKGSGIATPKSNIANISAISYNGGTTPSKGRSVTRRSLLPRQLNSAQEDSPDLPRPIKRRSSITQPAATSSISASTTSNAVFEQENTLAAKRSSPFKEAPSARGEKATNSENKDLLLIDEAPMKCDENIDRDLLSDHKMINSEATLCGDEPMLLLPEAAPKHQSPLLKFDSPVSKDFMHDPFATGDTPPRIPNVVLSPEQVLKEKDLIEW